MTIVLHAERIRLLGHCRVEDAESLTVMLQDHPSLALDLTECQGLHTAVVQVMLAFAPPIEGTPPAGVLNALLIAALIAPQA